MSGLSTISELQGIIRSALEELAESPYHELELGQSLRKNLDLAMEDTDHVQDFLNKGTPKSLLDDYIHAEQIVLNNWNQKLVNTNGSRQSMILPYTMCVGQAQYLYPLRTATEKANFAYDVSRFDSEGNTYQLHVDEGDQIEELVETAETTETTVADPSQEITRDEPTTEGSSTLHELGNVIGPGTKTNDEEHPDTLVEDNDVIRCVCNDNIEYAERDMVCCDGCNIWQHTDCLDLPSGEYWQDQEYYCDRCRPGLHAQVIKHFVWNPFTELYDDR